MTTPASRRVFIAGMVLFSLASLLGGFATTQAWLLAARAAQGVGAAVIAPTALISEHSTYGGGLFGPMLVTAAGLGMLFMPLTLVALSKVSDRDTGLASSLPNVGQQVGGSMGLALLGTVAWTVVANTARHSAADAKAGHSLAGTAAQVKTAIYDHALSVGFGRGSEVSAGIMLIALIITIAAVRSSAPTWPTPRLRRPARPGTTRAPRWSRPGNRPGRASRLMTWGSDGRVLIA